MSSDEELQDENDNIEELQDENDNIEEDVTSCTGRDDNIEEDVTSSTGRDQLVSNSAAEVTSNSSNLIIVEDIEYKGLRLLHLLIACAEAMSQEAQDLAEVILFRLQGLVSPTGFTMERVAYYLFDALLNVNSLAHVKPNGKSTERNFLGALKLLHVAYPYIRIPHFTANQCILEAVAAAGGASNVGIHVIDFDIMEGMQWPPLMEALRNNGNYYVTGHLRITAIKWADNEDGESLLYSSGTGRRLSEYASSVGIPFSFQEMDLAGLKDVLPQEGELLVVNCMWQLPHMFNLRNKSQLLEFLVGARHLNPVAVTLATGPHGAERDRANFLESFCRCLEELCAIFDSLEAGLPEHGLARAMVERTFFGPAMSRRVMSYGLAANRQSNVVGLPLDCGYGEGSISNANMLYAKYTLLCSGGSRSYRVESVGHHQLVLKWASTPLVWISTWKSP